MRDLKTYLSVAPVLSTLWFGALAGLFTLFTAEGMTKILYRIQYR